MSTRAGAGIKVPAASARVCAAKTKASARSSLVRARAPDRGKFFQRGNICFLLWVELRRRVRGEMRNERAGASRSKGSGELPTASARPSGELVGGGLPQQLAPRARARQEKNFGKSGETLPENGRTSSVKPGGLSKEPDALRL